MREKQARAGGGMTAPGGGFARVLGSRTISALVLIALTAAPSAALETTLEWRAGKETVIYTETLRAENQGFVAVITTTAGEYDSLSLDGRLSTLEWRRRVAAEGTDLVALRQGSKVRIEGTHKGKPYSRTLDFGDLPWYQFQELSYEEIFRAGARESAFWTIDRETLAPSLFRARRGGSSVIEVMGGPVEAIGYDLTVGGVPAFLFTSRVWLRESDGRFLRLDVPPVFNLPRSRVELTREKR